MDHFEIRKLITNRRTGKLLSSFGIRQAWDKTKTPIVDGRFDTESPAGRLACQAYYVWRMARFHGGADITMPPIMAMLFVDSRHYSQGDISELDRFADTLAEETFGTSMAVALRWGRALGF